uniref:Oligosaccharide flippase family protein n=1 Tax=Candidatus Desulfatibia profunda TaxID=2841695 RepID=A0A8J6TLM1_9BACT|nr:oligosaccharide flippase family protein [Candidatus Desulfatibia profunda]
MLARAIGFLTTWILVRHLTPDEYGIFSILDMVAGVSAGLITTGFNWSMVKSVASHRKDPATAWHIAGTVLKIEVIYGLILALGLYLGADFLSKNLFHKPELLFYLRLCSIGVLGNILFTYRNAIFQAFMKFRLNAVFTAGHSLCYLGIIILFLMMDQFSIRAISIVYVSLPLIISIIAIVLLRDGFKKARKERLSAFLSSMGSNYGWLLCYTLCLWFSGQFHMIILSRYFPMQEIGLYGFAYKIYGLSLMLMNAINSVLLPTFSGITENSALRKSFKKTLKGTAVVSVCLLVSIPFLGFFISVFAGERYSGACIMLQILIFGAAISTLLSPPVNILFALDKFKLIAIGGLIFVAINAAGQLTVTPVFGGLGAASIQVASHLVLCLWVTYHSFKLIGIKK